MSTAKKSTIGYYLALTAVWVGTIGLGLFMTSIFPTTLTLAEHSPSE